MPERFTGKVKWYKVEKGYGFIERPGDADVFVHVRQIRKAIELHAGDHVSFGIDIGPRGAFAVEVERVAA